MNSYNKKTPDISVVTDIKTKAAILRVKLNPFAFETYYIGYTQKLKSNHAKYILLTTQKWGKPFDIANYKLYAPISLQ